MNPPKGYIKNNREQLKNRFFVEGDPKAIIRCENFTVCNL